MGKKEKRKGLMGAQVVELTVNAHCILYLWSCDLLNFDLQSSAFQFLFVGYKD